MDRIGGTIVNVNINYGEGEWFYKDNGENCILSVACLCNSLYNHNMPLNRKYL